MLDEYERESARHYGRADLETALLAAVVAAGRDPQRLHPDDLVQVDEFHIGGREATVDLAAQLPLRPGVRLLDVGSGIGGASRYFAHHHGVWVSGVDLTQEYVALAERLARATGLADRLDYRCASAQALPFAAGTFAGAYMLHVGMNIADKARAFAEVGRVLEPGGFFAIYDIMREGAGEVRYPTPWAAAAEQSFLASAADYRVQLEAAGFAVRATRSRRDFALEFFTRMRARAQDGPAPLGLHILMGDAAAEKLANAVEAVAAGTIAPTEVIASKRTR